MIGTSAAPHLFPPRRELLLRALLPILAARPALGVLGGTLPTGGTHRGHRTHPCCATGLPDAGGLLHSANRLRPRGLPAAHRMPRARRLFRARRLHHLGVGFLDGAPTGTAH
ncbi:hypothetical protein [Frankia sp. AiPa1]|uniref:hypothetical protein n=1 Tax=Frankia sp. AiPa1 TaxID=573492 RepID=UPI00202B8704|nr:hypothetical protein [Frankia sp. AiPa1]MCL9760724.1 hypothetical protein [Frankia sp. AiPa1]